MSYNEINLKFTTDKIKLIIPHKIFCLYWSE